MGIPTCSDVTASSEVRDCTLLNFVFLSPETSLFDEY